ncbi:hypothetical protein O4J56_16845 [Nocardiopsis sp. RSe5-2]|uniref:Uncharacterized protein n=1 Tax=Nocardiopsis endophytica TaxID=3018445 RepID=A0ABT4U5U0_9ACTN|nr:hypothetical protein [Nocardiopsis endophytica]MDA2812312.1 hypothetical protein [Nocardiopsis endophytica]
MKDGDAREAEAAAQERIDLAALLEPSLRRQAANAIVQRAPNT